MVKIHGKQAFTKCEKLVDPRLVIRRCGSSFQCIGMALLRTSTVMTVTLKPYWVGELEAVPSALATRPLKISMLARKQGLNMLKSTAQWSWININGAQFYVQACQDANVQAINCFSLMISVVLIESQVTTSSTTCIWLFYHLNRHTQKQTHPE